MGNKLPTPEEFDWFLDDCSHLLPYAFLNGHSLGSPLFDHGHTLGMNLLVFENIGFGLAKAERHHNDVDGDSKLSNQKLFEEPDEVTEHELNEEPDAQTTLELVKRRLAKNTVYKYFKSNENINRQIFKYLKSFEIFDKSDFGKGSLSARFELQVISFYIGLAFCFRDYAEAHYAQDNPKFIEDRFSLLKSMHKINADMYKEDLQKFEEFTPEFKAELLRKLESPLIPPPLGEPSISLMTEYEKEEYIESYRASLIEGLKGWLATVEKKMMFFNEMERDRGQLNDKVLMIKLSFNLLYLAGYKPKLSYREMSAFREMEGSHHVLKNLDLFEERLKAVPKKLDGFKQIKGIVENLVSEAGESVTPGEGAEFHLSKNMFYKIKRHYFYT